MIRPLGTNIVANKPVEAVTKAGIYLSEDMAKALAPKKAKVLAIGELVKNVKAGDEIVYKPYAIFDIELENKEQYIVIDSQDILGVVE
jgi:co-chaperonin GroES (HSP10)